MTYAYNTSVHQSTGMTPYYLMFGREARLPVDFLVGEEWEPEIPLEDWVVKHQRSLTMAYDGVQ